MNSAAGQISFRAFAPADEAAVLDLLCSSLGWARDERHARLFAWKHRDSPFGPSPAWVATIDGRIVGFRTFLRWEFELDGRPVRAVRAVDTATHPDARGRGIFVGLTEHALDELRADGVSFVFNTPNDQSRPGYLKLGWRPVRRLAVLARPRAIVAIGRIARARTTAEKWSLSTTVGDPAAEAFADPADVTALLDSGPSSGLRTRRSASYLAWRYGLDELCYRVVGSDEPAPGLIVFRLRRRGPAVELAVCEELVPGADAATTRRLLRDVLGATRADYAVRVGDHLPRAGYVPLGRRGPLLVCRQLATTPPPLPDAWHLGLGDVELF